MYKEDQVQFWENIYLADDAGWDLGGATPVFKSIANELIPGKMCIVGCGSGHDAVMFAQKQFEVIGVDFAESALCQKSCSAVLISNSEITLSVELESKMLPYR